MNLILKMKIGGAIGVIVHVRVIDNIGGAIIDGGIDGDMTPALQGLAIAHQVLIVLVLDPDHCPVLGHEALKPPG